MEKDPNNLIGLMADQNPHQLIGLLGILKSGGGFVPIDPDYPLDRIDFMIRDSRIEILVTESSHLNKALQISRTGPPLKHIICLDQIDKPIIVPDGVELYDYSQMENKIAPMPVRNPGAGPGRTAYLVYTSGSTGKPKGVPITHENYFPLLLWSERFFNYGEQTRTLQSLSFCFDFGIYEVLTTVLLGGTIYFIDKNQRMDPPSYADWINHHAINTVHSTPSFFNELAYCGCELRTLKDLHLGGEALMSASVGQLFDMVADGCSINNWYGPSETTVNSSVFELGTRRTKGEIPSITVPIGKASAKNRLYVLDRYCNLAPDGVSGELYIGGPGLAPAYLNRPDLTAERFIPSSFDAQPGARLYKTGDLVRRLSGGHLEFLGRLDHQVKVRGFRIELGEIEVALAEHTSAREAVVLAIEDRPGSKRLVAYLTLEHEPGPTNSEWRIFLSRQLPDYMIPSAFVILKSLPLTSNGKLDRRALPLPEAGRPDLGCEFIAPRTVAEEMTAGVCVEVLGLGRIGINDNLFDLGCHSLLATKIVLRLRETFGVELPLVRLFENPTVAGLAEGLAGMKRQDAAASKIPPIREAPRSGPIPLSFAQERVWFLCELDPTAVSYHVPRAVRIAGRFSVAALEQTFDEIVRRHEILRTTFPKIDGRPVQLIHAPGPLEIRISDLRPLAEAEREKSIHGYILEEGRRPFDLEKGPFLRLSVLLLDRHEHIFILTEHHLIHDGWTQGVLVRDFLALYESTSQGIPSPLPELAVQYADFAYWQRQWMSGEALEKQLDYWRRELAGAPPVFDLPADRPRPAVQSFRGAEYSLTINGELAEALRIASRREGVTLFMTMLAAFKTLLYRYTGQEDMVVGSWVANRRVRETEGLLGMIINTIILRTDLSGAPSFRELLKRVRQVCLGAYEHQDLPFERLVAELQPERSLSYNPLFQVLFAFQDTATPALELSGMRMEVMNAHNQSAKFDLNVIVLPHREQLIGLGASETTDEITILIEYSRDLFEERTVRRLAGHYETLLATAVKEMNESIAEMAILSEGERKELLEEWNETAAEYPREKCVDILFEEQSEMTPDATAIICEEKHLSYAELNRRANWLAHYLRRVGIGAEARVALYLDRSPEMVMAMLGTIKSGGTFVPIDPAYPEERVAYMLEDAQAQVVVTRRRSAEKLPEGRAIVVCLDADWKRMAGESDDRPQIEAMPESPAYVIYTSGSTGKPKGVCIERGALTNLIMAMSRGPGLSAGDILLAITSFSFDISLLEIFLPLVVGARVVIATKETVADGHRLGRELTESGATHMQSTPTTWRLLVETGWMGGAGLNILCGGEALTKELADKLALKSSRLWNLYGPTETTIWSGIWQKERTDEEIPIGRPIANTRFYILDERYQPAPIGVAGELYIGGAGMARGYLNRPELTGERFIPNPFGLDMGERLYRTGDLARFRPDGNVEFLRRLDHQVKVRGYRIELEEIETVLAGHSGVKQCVVCVREDRPGDKRLVAYVTPAGEAPPSSSDLRRFLLGTLPDYMTPSVFVNLPELPATLNGKLDRRALPAPAAEEATVESKGPRTPVEEITAGIWAEVLGLAEVGSHQNFFESGGHSLLAAQLISRVRNVFGVEAPLRTLFERPTPAGLAAAVETALAADRRSEGTPINPVIREQALPLSFGQQRLWFFDRLEPGNVIYNCPGAVLLEGDLNVKALEQALSEMVRRHESLRTTFQEIDGRPVQVIDPPYFDPISVIDLTGIEAGLRAHTTDQLVLKEASGSFDLERGALFRVKLLKTGPRQHLLSVTMHHIIGDWASFSVFERETAELYSSYVNGREAELKELPIQYADYAVWQRERQPAEIFEQQLGYWKKRLTGAPITHLATDHPQPSARSFLRAKRGLSLSASLTARLRLLSRQEGCTLFMTLLAVFYIELYRYTHDDDLVVGTPISNRNRTEIEGLIGFFINMLTLRADVSGNPSLRLLLGRVRETTVGAYTHQDIPFEKLVEDLRPERSPEYIPFFQILFIFHNALRSQIELPGLTLSPTRIDFAAPGAEFCFVVSEETEGLNLSVLYSPDLFEDETVIRMLNHYRKLLEEAVEHLDRPISDLEMLDDIERRTVLEEWNRTDVPYPADRCIHEFMEEKCGQMPEAIALICGRDHLSYRELNGRANRLANYLRRQGVGSESAVGICLERSLEMVVSILGVLKAGGAYLPLDPSYPKQRVRYMLEDSWTTLVLSGQRDKAWLKGAGVRVIGVDTQWREIDEESGRMPDSGVGPENPAYVIYTSGSTGLPKGVVNRHGSLVNRLLWMRHAYQVDENDRVLHKTPFSFDVSVWELLLPLTAGAQMVIAEPEGHKDSAYLSGLIEREQVTIVHFVPSMLGVFLSEEQAHKLTSVRCVICSGEELTIRLQENLVERMTAQMENLYGPTEAAIDVTRWSCVKGSKRARVPIGRPIWNTQIYILDERMEPVPVGAPGDIYIGGAGLARGYVSKGDLTAESFLPCPYGDWGGARMYQTRDLGRYLSDGSIEYLGRTDHQVKVRGFRIELGEIASVARQLSGIRDAVITLGEDAAGDRKLIGYYVCEREKEPATGDLTELLRERVPEYMVPTVWVKLDALPLTLNGKIDRKRLPAPEKTRRKTPESYVAPRTQMEEEVAAIFREVLKLDRIGVSDSFFELGGHSLMATQVISRLRKIFQVEIPLKVLFTTAFTVEEMANTLTRLQIQQIEVKELAELFNELNELSDGEAESLLVHELMH
jgi:amino acid adenylation domain-containing protein